MRELLFKGKAKGTGEWISGGYFQRAEAKYYFKKDQALIHSYIASDWTTYFGLPRELTLHEVESSTICQYTGLTDKNGKKIFEGDILRGFQYPFCYDGYYNYYAEIIFANCSFMTYTHKNPLSCVRGISDGNTELMECWVSEDWEVIGNIYDNPELLEDKEK